MARTKQTARKSTGGRAPRRQLATKAARSFRQYMTSQQNLGNAVINNNSSNKQTNKTSFINYENTLSSFSFRPDKGSHGETAEFSPRFSVASTKDKQTGSTEDWLGITFESKYDGQGIKQHPREPIGICICLDISGSMGWSFSEDTPGTFGNFARGGKSKLEVAKTCIKAILEQLSPDDLFSVVLFNHDHQTFLPLQSVGSLNRGKFQRDLAKLKPSGGTCLGEGFEAGARIFDFGVQTRKKKSGGPSRASQLKNKRVVFLTDMESHIADEESVLETARLCADDGTCFTTIVGIGVDLSVGTVQALSSIAGAKYSSCINSKEFEKTIGEEFLHDVTPIAFHINIKSLTSGAVFSKGYGSPELNALKDQQDIKLSSEFPSVYAADGQVLGGMMLVKLNLDGLATGNTSRGLGNKAVGKGKKKAKDERRFVLQVKWTAPSGEQRVEIANVTMPPAFPEEEAKEQANNDADGDEMMVPQQQEEEEDGRYSNTNIRKAIALVRYVDLQSEYVLDDTLQAEGGDRAAAGGGGSGLPLDAQRAVHQSYIQRFATFEPWLRRELRACGDTSVEAGGANANVTDTLRQIVELEQRELAGLETRAGAAAAGGEGREAENERLAAQPGLPAEFLCPIGRGLMGDPVVAGDGHSYDRAAIAAWIAARGGGGGAGVPSPMTLRALPSLALTPNIALRKMIADYRAAHPPPGAAAATAAAAAGPLGPGLAAGGGGAAAGRKKGAAAGRRNKGAATAGNEKEVPKLAAAKNNSTKKKQLAVDRNGKVGGKYNLRRRNMK